MSPDEIENQENGLTDETLDDGGYFPTKEFYLKSGEEIAEVFPGLDDALTNTLEIADKCEPYFFSKEPLMPAYTIVYGCLGFLKISSVSPSSTIFPRYITPIRSER